MASGSVWRRTPRGWRRQRFSELDPVQLARLADAASGVERLAAYRRLGDLALFLTGVFPDHVAARPLVGARAERLLRLLSAGNLAVVEGAPAPEPGFPAAGIGLLEELGRRAYRVVVRTAGTAREGMMRALGEAADRFREARRVLNFLADGYLFRARERWFPSPGT